MSAEAASVTSGAGADEAEKPGAEGLGRRLPSLLER